MNRSLSLTVRITAGCLLLSAFAFSQNELQPVNRSNDAFKAGEWFEFRIHYLLFNASYASLELKETVIDSTPVIHAKGYGKTTGLARIFFRVEDYYESYFEPETVSPKRFIRNIDEGGYTKNVVVNFEKESQKAHVFNKKTGEKKTFETQSNIQDLISVFYYLRNYFPFETAKAGQSLSVNMFFDNDNYTFKLKYLGVEALKTKFGLVECLKFRPIVQSGRIFREEESVTIWVSNDKNKIPIRIQADIVVGAIKVDLENFKNLKHPFQIQFKK